MSSSEITDIRLSHGDGKATDGRLYTTVYTSGERMQRALLRLVLLWGLAGVTVFIPLAHFVLVPGFLIAGPVVAVLVYRTEQARDRAEGQCPACGEAVTIKLEAKDEIPKWTYCPACNAALQITGAAE